MSDDIEPSTPGEQPVADTPSDELQAVSAALDGTATVDERALIDASPELGQLLAELEGARQSMIDVPVPSQAREAGIAVALAAFDDQQSAPVAAAAMPAASPSNVVAFERKKRFYRTITAAAAAVVVLVVGIAALGSLGGSDDNDESSTAAVVATDDMSATKMEAPAAAATEAPAETDAPAPLAVAESGALDDAGSAQTEAADETAAPAETDAVASTISEIPTAGDVTPSIPDEESLAAYVATAPARVEEDDCVPTGHENLGQISYQGTPAVVARDPGTGEVLVYGTADCAVLGNTAQLIRHDVTHAARRDDEGGDG